MEGSKIFRALFIILIAITSATIFHFSSENGEISGNTSGKVIKNDNLEKTVQIIMTIIENEKKLEETKIKN